MKQNSRPLPSFLYKEFMEPATFCSPGYSYLVSKAALRKVLFITQFYGIHKRKFTTKCYILASLTTREISLARLVWCLPPLRIESTMQRGGRHQTSLQHDDLAPLKHIIIDLNKKLKQQRRQQIV